MSLVRKIWLHDGNGNPIGSLGGALNIHDADVHTKVVNQNMHQHVTPSTTLAVATVGDGTEYQITVASAAGLVAGDFIHIGNGTTETTHPKIISIAVNTLTLDRRIDIAHAIGTPVVKAILNMALAGIVGSLASPQIFYAGPSGTDVWHITRFLFAMAHATAGDLGTFGDRPALTNGVALRAKISNQYYTFSNWKNNGDMKADMYDVTFDVRSGGGGAYGTSGRGTFTNAGSVLRLDAAQGDRLELLIQDDITALGFFTMKIQGHPETL